MLNIYTSSIIVKLKKNETVKREEKIIFYGTKDMHANLNNNNIKQFFIDFTYNIIPIAYKPYKLLTIKGFNVEIKQSVLFP